MTAELAPLPARGRQTALPSQQLLRTVDRDGGGGEAGRGGGGRLWVTASLPPGREALALLYSFDKVQLERLTWLMGSVFCEWRKENLSGGHGTHASDHAGAS